MLKDKNFSDYYKMMHKYSGEFKSFLQNLKELYYKELPLLDFDGNDIVFIENHASVNQEVIKLLMQSQDWYYGIKAAEDEIIATCAIESIDFSRDSVRKILKGMAPKDEQENRTVADWVRRMKRKTCVLFLKTGEITACLSAVGIDLVIEQNFDIILISNIKRYINIRRETEE